MGEYRDAECNHYAEPDPPVRVTEAAARRESRGAARTAAHGEIAEKVKRALSAAEGLPGAVGVGAPEVDAHGNLVMTVLYPPWAWKGKDPDDNGPGLPPGSVSADC